MLQRSTLSNGIRVVTENIPSARSVSIGVQALVGSLDDPEDRPGLAHFAEHGLFQGTSDRAAADISLMIDESGGHMGAFTGRDYTSFHAHVMQDYSTFATDLLGDMLLNSTFPEDQLAREKEAIVSEIKLSHDNPFSRLNDVLRSEMWASTPHGRPITGTAESVSNFSREDVIYFVGQNYTPDRIVVAAAGAVDHEGFVGQVQDGFWRMIGSAPTTTPRPAPNYKPIVHVDRSGPSQTYFAVAIPTLAYNADQRYELHALNTLLGGGLSSRLYRTLREERGLTYYVQSEYHAYQNIGLLWIEGVTPVEKLLPAIEAIYEQIEDVANNPVDEEELWKAKMQLRGQHELSGDSLHTRMSRLATQEIYFGKPLGDDLLNGIQQVEADAVQEIASKLLQTRPSCAILGPPDMDDAFETHLDGLLSRRESSSLSFSLGTP